MTERRETYAAMVVRSTSEIELATLPRDALADNAVRVAVAAAGVNPVDAGNRADGTWAGLDASYVVGYEFAGLVLAVGRAVSDLEPGDDVWGCCPCGVPAGVHTQRRSSPTRPLSRVAHLRCQRSRPRRSHSPGEPRSRSSSGSSRRRASGCWCTVQEAASGISSSSSRTTLASTLLRPRAPPDAYSWSRLGLRSLSIDT